MQVWRATVLQTGQSDEQRTITGLAEDYAGLLNLSRATTRLPRSGLVQQSFSRVNMLFTCPAAIFSKLVGSTFRYTADTSSWSKMRP